MSAALLRKTIDRMVEDAIRRILPGVMNEVLLRTIAGSSVVSETSVRSARPAERPAPRPTKVRPPARSNVDLHQLLDESAGADFYAQAEPDEVEAEEEGEIMRPEPPRSMAERVQNLPPHLQALAEDVDISGFDDEDEAPSPAGIRDINRAASSAGIDFSRMRAVIGATSRPKQATADDASAKLQFEELRLKRLREQLGGT